MILDYMPWILFLQFHQSLIPIQKWLLRGKIDQLSEEMLQLNQRLCYQANLCHLLKDQFQHFDQQLTILLAQNEVLVEDLWHKYFKIMIPVA